MKSKKDKLRQKFRFERSSLKDKDKSDDDIFRLLTQWDVYKNCYTVFVYSSVGSEVGTWKIIENALAEKKQVALPKCLDSSGEMEFYYIDSTEDLSDGMYGIKEPKPKIAADCKNPAAVCLVPALSFDMQGYRLGYGKGYYDRFLSRFEGISVGLCYSQCMSRELPKDTYDKAVNYLITDNKIYNFQIKEE